MELMPEPEAGTPSLLDGDQSQGPMAATAPLPFECLGVPSVLWPPPWSTPTSNPGGQRKKGIGPLGVTRPCFSNPESTVLLCDLGQISSPLWFSGLSVTKDLNRMIS